MGDGGHPLTTTQAQHLALARLVLRRAVDGLVGPAPAELIGTRTVMAVGPPITALPGSELIAAGLEDLVEGRRTVAALVVSIGAPRLGQLGFEVSDPIDDADHVLYELLAAEDADSAHGRYNALVRLLVSFERAAACVD